MTSPAHRRHLGKLKTAGRRYRAAETAHTKTRNALITVVQEATAAGLGPSAIAEASGWSVAQIKIVRNQAPRAGQLVDDGPGR